MLNDMKYNVALSSDKSLAPVVWGGGGMSFTLFGNEPSLDKISLFLLIAFF